MPRDIEIRHFFLTFHRVEATVLSAIVSRARAEIATPRSRHDEDLNTVVPSEICGIVVRALLACRINASVVLRPRAILMP